ncbi:hypothetical protein ALC62_05924 [Cyphomyrmex costatus]|uniref:Uncharacterized protein n=1 Tax=Cyphomyrmex costatus TaxID=456900 RepID=A0A195CRC7_9HYME|nr:hypothetical protein ALC62_05924 [Cyphomyrmex costatus]
MTRKDLSTSRLALRRQGDLSATGYIPYVDRMRKLVDRRRADHEGIRDEKNSSMADECGGPSTLRVERRGSGTGQNYTGGGDCRLVCSVLDAPSHGMRRFWCSTAD